MDSIRDDASRAASILVVEDNRATRAFVRMTLEEAGYDVTAVARGQEAIEAFQARRPDCVLLDVWMPEMDGFTVCERLRALPDGTQTPVLFLTAHRDVEIFDRAMRAGGDDFLTKPIRPEELAARIKRALDLRPVKTELPAQYGLLKRERDDLRRLQLQIELETTFIVHDLKRPVSSIELHAQLVLREDDVSSSVRESATEIRTRARQLIRLILNLLDVSRAHDGLLAAQPTDVDLRRVVDDVIAELEVVARGCDVTLTTSLETDRIYADEDLLRRALANLVENGIRHAPPNTSMTVTSVTAADGGTELRVSDRGVGVAPRLREKIFDAHAHVESADAGSHRSRGIGLAFCKHAVEAHGGRIWIEDAAPGAAFCVRLPKAPERT